MLFEGIVNRFAKLGNAGRPFARFSGLGSLAVATVEPELTEVVRAGLRFAGGCQVIANGIAPIVTIPTTTATLALYNNSGGARSLVVDRLGYALGSGTPAAGASIYLSVSKPTTPPTANASNYSTANIGGSVRASIALWTLALTIPATSWFIANSNQQLAAVNIGQGGEISNMKSGIIIPPFYALGIAIFSGAGTTPLYSVSAQWSELELDLE